MPPELAPFLGRWEHSRLRLVLELGPEAGVVGALELGGRVFPAEGARVEERIEGRFQAGERELPFKLLRVEGGLTLSCDGRSYALRRAVASDAARDPFAGSYVGPRPTETSTGEKSAGEEPAGEEPAGEGPAGEEPAGEEPAGEGTTRDEASGLPTRPRQDPPTLELQPRGEGYAGVLVLGGIRYALTGEAHRGESGQELRGSLRDPLTGRSLGFSLSRVEEQLLLTVRFEGEEKRVSYETLVFRSR